MAIPYAKEFDPSMTEGYLASQLNNLDEERDRNIGTARQEGASAGLVGQAASGSRIGAAENAYNVNKNAAISGFNLDVANKKYSERMTDESRSFQDMERQKQDEFTKSMTEMGYNFERERQSKSLRAAKSGQLMGLASSVIGAAGTVAGADFGGPVGAAAGGKLGSLAGRSLSSGFEDETGGGSYSYQMDRGAV